MTASTTASTELHVTSDTFATEGVFTISRGSRTQAKVLTVTLTSQDCRGWGECVPYARYGETLESVAAQIRSMTVPLREGLTRDELQSELPAGAARNALDCALWDLQSKQENIPVWQLAGLAEPQPVMTAYTLSLDTPEKMQAAAARHAARPMLKIKLGGEGDMDRLRAVRHGAPDSRLIVDANEGWNAAQYDALAPVMLTLGVDLVEQPLPSDNDDLLSGRDRPLPVCADEACHDRTSLPALLDKYDVINIKLDKTGGLTEALALHQAARDAGFRVMVGCMVGSSLAMAPALLVAQSVEFVDLDGPLLLSEDRDIALRYEGSLIHPADRKLWG